MQCCSVQYYRYCTFLQPRNSVITLAFLGVVLSKAVRPGNQALVDIFQALRNYVVCLFLLTRIRRQRWWGQNTRPTRWLHIFGPFSSCWNERHRSGRQLWISGWKQSRPRLKFMMFGNILMQCIAMPMKQNYLNVWCLHILIHHHITLWCWDVGRWGDHYTHLYAQW